MLRNRFFFSAPSDPQRISDESTSTRIHHQKWFHCTTRKKRGEMKDFFSLQIWPAFFVCLAHVREEEKIIILHANSSSQHKQPAKRENQMIIWCSNVSTSKLFPQVREMQVNRITNKLSRIYFHFRWKRQSTMHSTWTCSQCSAKSERNASNALTFRHIHMLILFIARVYMTMSRETREIGLMTSIHETWKCFLSYKSWFSFPQFSVSFSHTRSGSGRLAIFNAFMIRVCCVGMKKSWKINCQTSERMRREEKIVW